jgi:hypothetical protein
LSTAGVYGLRLGGIDKITYIENFALPGELGEHIAQCIAEVSLLLVKDIFPKIIMVSWDSEPTPEQVVECEQFLGENGDRHDWHALLYKAQGELDHYFAERLQYMVDDQDCIKDSLYCGWAYIINLDTEMFEVWKGLQTKPQSGNRYGEAPVMHVRNKYYPCELQAQFPLSNIPADWVDQVIHMNRQDDSKAIVHKVNLSIYPYGHKWTVDTDRGTFVKAVQDDLSVPRDEVKNNENLNDDLIACIMDTWFPQSISKIIKEY